MNGHDTPESILNKLRLSETDKVKVAVCDIDGILRGKYLHLDKFIAAAQDGFGFCDVIFGWDSNDACYDNVSYTGWHTGYPDARARVDLRTHRRVPWENDIDFFLCDFDAADGGPLPVCPRRLLRTVCERLDAAGYRAKVGFEYEWFNFKETPQSLADKRYLAPAPLSPGMFGYSILRAGLNHAYCEALMEQLAAFGVPLEGLHTETGPGTYEACILAADALEAADRAALFRTAVKQIAYSFGIMASFMARWSADVPGCGGHIHVSLQDRETGDNLFHDPARPGVMPAVFEQFLAGQMHCLPAWLAFFAPTVNSYKRLVEGYWAPVTVSWGYDNRTTAYRVINGSGKSARLEIRVGGADLNPYIALAAALASGLYGIERGMKLTHPPAQGSAYRGNNGPRLARDLGEAVENLAESGLARELLGEPFVEHFVNTRRWEWRQYQRAVTDWELRRYFEII